MIERQVPSRKGVFIPDITVEMFRNASLEGVGELMASGEMEDISFPSAQQEQRWIPCSERLPEPRVDVWTCSDIGQIQGYYEEHVGIWYASFGQGRDYLELYVTAWMPLPEPYREDKE